MKCPFSKVAGAEEVAAEPLSKVLREATSEAHERAEHHPLQQAMVKGGIDRATFAVIVREMRRVHLAVDAGVAALRAEPRYAAWGTHVIDRDEIFEKDLEALGVKLPDAAPMPATVALEKKIQSQIAAKDYAGLAGGLYVLEGSTNGGMFISKAVERTLGLEKGRGTSWLNPYGDQVRVRWGQARELLDGLKLSAEEQKRAVAGADAMFLTIEAVMEDLKNSLANGAMLGNDVGSAAHAAV